jgi:Transposase DDE domain
MINTLLQRLDELIRPDRAEQLAKQHGWRKRKGKISAFQFLYSTLGQASAVDLTLSAQAGSFTQPVTRQAVDQRYNPAAVQYFQAAFQQGMATSLAWKTDSAMTQTLQRHFGAVRLFDSTHSPCSDALAKIFPACGGGGGQAGLKVLLCYEYATGQLQPLEVVPAKCSDQGLALRVCEQIGPEELGIIDKGFYKAQGLRSVAERGGYFLVPWPQGVSVWELDAAGQPGALIDVAACLKASTQNRVEWAAVELGQTQDTRLGPVRLIACRLKEEQANRRRAALREKCRTYRRQPTEAALELAGWIILLTNAPASLLPTAAVGYLYRVRWQVELIFKQWKSVLRLDVLPSTNPNRTQCEVWARLLTALLASVWHQHANVVCLQLHEREISFSKVAKLLQQQGQSLVRALFGHREQIHSEMRSLWKKILKLARKERQLSRPTTWENLLSHWLELLPA